MLQVEVRNMNTGDLAIFKVNAWLSKTKGDHKLVRDIAATVKGKEVVKGESFITTMAAFRSSFSETKLTFLMNLAMLLFCLD